MPRQPSPAGARLDVGALPPLPVCDEARHLTLPLAVLIQIRSLGWGVEGADKFDRISLSLSLSISLSLSVSIYLFLFAIIELRASN